MIYRHLEITITLCAALACAACWTAPPADEVVLADVVPNWTAPPAKKVARVDVASQTPPAASNAAPAALTTVMTIDGLLAPTLAEDMAHSKPVRHQGEPHERGPFVVFRSANGDVLGLCELLADGAFIPFAFQTRKGVVIPGKSLTEPDIYYKNFQDTKAWRAMLSLWKLQNAPSLPNTSE